MADPQMEEFYGRLRRVSRNHRRGAAFATTDTLGGVAYRPRAQRPSLMRPALLAVAIFMGLKAALLIEIGPEDYQGRVDRLRQGSQVEAAGAWPMQMDPLTVWLSEQLRALFKPSA